MNHNDRLDRKSFKQQQADLIPNDRTKHYQNDKMPDKQKKQQHEHQRSGHTSGNEHKHCSVEQRTGKPIALKWKSTMQTRASSWSSHERLLMSYVQLSLILPLLIVLLASSSLHHQQLSATIAHAQPAGLAFPGVSRDLASFCSARPSLSIDLAPMLVHVKRNTSFNYKLYLFSSDQHVFQTGQIVPRDDFRIHSFPVKLKPLQEFVPIDESSTVQQQQQAGQGSPSASGVEVYELVKETTHNHNGQHSKRPMLIRVPSSSFSPKRFFAQVPLNPDENETPQPMSRANKRSRSAQSLPSGLPTTSTTTTTTTTSRPSSRVFPFDVQGDVLPGDHEWISHHDVASHTDAPPTTTTTTKQPQQTNANEHIEFDRDDQVAILSQTANKLRELNRRNSGDQSHVGRGEQQESQSGHRSARSNQHRQHQTMVMPVGSFSSFRVNFTYLARKDFGQVEPELVRLRVDPQRFRVSRVDLLAPIKSEPQRPALNSSSSKDDHQADGQEEAPDDSDYTFLSHKLLRDPNTRITSITQVYEDWITRNFYTIVYIQRRLNMGGGTSSGDDHRDSSEHDDVTLAADELEDSSRYGAGGRGQQQQQQHGRNHRHHNQKQQSRYELVSDRLVFRGSSIVLLGADQLNYHVKASAFITEKNGLHYYLEFLPNGKFYLGAIDWTKRPFKFIDSQRFPIKPTQTQFDNEELLLCPPSVCYSDQPIDELVGYGRLALSDKLQREATILSKSSSSSSSSSLPSPSSMVEHRKGTIVDLLPLQSQHLVANNSSAASTETTVSHQSEPISLDNLIEAMKSGSSRLDVRLHLRDWVWQVPRVQQPVVDGNSKRSQSTNGTTDGITTAHSASSTTSKFAWRYEWARRNEMKVAPDTYGFALVGHEIDASYRVYNELYLISANQLISINYTLANETVTSVHPIEDEFAGLSSSLLDPITGAFYDRYSNQIYFFKGDRYVGYDYATKKPLEEFLLPPAIDDSLGGLGLALMMQQKQQQPLLIASSPTNTMTRTPTINSNNQRMLALAAEPKQPLQSQLVSTLPVVGILGRQHHVDAIYHDLTDDVVYVFAGMKFYTHQANDFKDGAFRTQQGNKGSEHEQPRMHCINEHFLASCRFDAAYPNPCKGYGRHEGHQDELRHHHYHHYPDELEEEHDGDDDGETNGVAVKHLAKLTEASEPDANRKTASANNNKPERVTSFSEEQQMKLRSIAARGGLMDYLLENTLVAQGAARAFEPFLAQGNSGGGPVSRTSDQEQIVIYLLISMVLVTVLVTVAMIVVVLNWARFKSTDDHQYGTHGKPPSSGDAGPLAQGQLLTERIATPSVISQYLSNKYQQQQQHNRQRQPATYHYGPQPFTPAGRRLSAHRSPMVPLTSPPQIPPPPEPWRRPYRSHHLPDESQSGQANSGVGPNGAGSLDHHPSHGSLVDNSVF